MTTEGQPLRVGVIGVGFGAVVHVPGFRSEGWDVPVVWGRRVDRAREKAAELGVPETAEDWRDIVARDDLDAIAITTPPAAHHEMVMAALRAGKHVLCEKPFALDAMEARAMRDLAREQGLTAMVAHEFRFAPQRAQIKDLLDGGRIGTPELVSAELLMGRPRPDTPPPFTWAADRSQGGGLLGALGSHYIDGLRHWFGDVVEVSGRLTTRTPARVDAEGNPREADTDDTFSVNLLFENDVVATMTASSQVSPSLGARITIAGSEGVLVATQRGPNPEPDGVVLAGGAGERELAPLPVDPKYVPIEDDRDQRLAAFRLLVREFARGIREGVSPAPNFEDATACQEILDAIRAASDSGRTMRIREQGNGRHVVALIPGTVDRFDKFSQAARRAFTEAIAEAHDRGDDLVDSADLLVALCRSTDSPSRAAFAALSVDGDALEGALPDERERAPADQAGGLTGDARRSIELAVEAARSLSTGEIEAAHLLLGIARADGEGAHVLERLGVDEPAVHEAVARALAR